MAIQPIRPVRRPRPAQGRPSRSSTSTASCAASSRTSPTPCSTRPGAGLAAPQIGVGLRVFTWHVEGEVGHLVNPSLDLSEDIQDGAEGCLSLPGLSIDCKRARSVVARGFDMHGEPVTIEGTDLLARAIQHETDHLDGVLFIDRLDPDSRKQAMKLIRESEWFGLEPPTVKVSPHPTFGGLAL